MSLRKIIKTRGSFPSEEAAIKLLYLALQECRGEWETVQHLEAGAEPLADAVGRSDPGGSASG